MNTWIGSLITETASIPSMLPATTSTEPTSIWLIVRLFLSLTTVILLIIVSLRWLLPKLHGNTPVSRMDIQILGIKKIGAKKEIVIVRIGSRDLVLGVTDYNINLLHEMKHQVDEVEAKGDP